MWSVQYVSAQQLAGFRQYKYRAVDSNPLSVYIMQPLWNRIVKIVPLWIAPNLLTLTGFLMILIHYFILCIYDWDYTASGSSPGLIPTWVWGFGAFASFLAYTLDCIDGKHARRTQSSSPLGELFDHGLDSWATSIFPLSFFSICSYGNGKGGVPVSMYLSLMVILLNFIFSHWEKYNTGVLFLPWGYDLSQVILVGMYLLTAVFGIEVWQRPFIFGYYITDILQMLLIVLLHIVWFGAAFCLGRYRAYRNKTLLKDSLYEALLPLWSPMLLFTLLTIWAFLSPCEILVKQTRLFLWMVGVVFSNVICRMIICQMTNTRAEVLHWLLIPLAVMVYTATAGFQGKLEEPMLAAFTIFVTAVHVHYGICVGKQLSQHFNVYIFSMKKYTK